MLSGYLSVFFFECDLASDDLWLELGLNLT